MYSVELKIKRKNLADEARDIRKEERRAKAVKGGGSREYFKLWYHRTQHVRGHARTAHLAHAFLTGRAYRSVERNSRTTPRLANITETVVRFNPISGIEGRDADSLTRSQPSAFGRTGTDTALSELRAEIHGLELNDEERRKRYKQSVNKLVYEWYHADD
jgi:hypothetical protein